jgi:dynein heavy chain 1
MLVQLTLEAVICLTTNTLKPLEWSAIRKAMSGDDFIPSVSNFNTENLKPAVSKRVQEKYIDHKDWDCERINKASQAAGPLAKWVES